MSLRPRVRAVSGDDDGGESLAAPNGDGSRVDRRGFGPLDDVSLGTAECDAVMATITCGAKPITEGQDWGASSLDRSLTEVDRQRQSSDDGGWHRDSCRSSEQRRLSSPVHIEGDGIPVSHAYKSTASLGEFGSSGHFARALARSSSPLILL